MAMCMGPWPGPWGVRLSDQRRAQARLTRVRGRGLVRADRGRGRETVRKPASCPSLDKDIGYSSPPPRYPELKYPSTRVPV